MRYLERTEAVRRCVQFVDEEIQEESIRKDLNRQIFLGDDRFVTRMQAMSDRLPIFVCLSGQAAPGSACR